MGSANPPDGTQQSVLVLSKDALLHMCWLGCAERGALNLHLNRNPLGLTVNALVSWRNLIPPALFSTYLCNHRFFYCCLIGRVSNSIALAVVKIKRSRFCKMETANFLISELQSKHLVSFKIVFIIFFLSDKHRQVSEQQQLTTSRCLFHHFQILTNCFKDKNNNDDVSTMAK